MGRIIKLLKFNSGFIKTIIILIFALLLLDKDPNLLVKITALVVAVTSFLEIYFKLNDDDESANDE